MSKTCEKKLTKEGNFYLAVTQKTFEIISPAEIKRKAKYYYLPACAAIITKTGQCYNGEKVPKRKHP